MSDEFYSTEHLTVEELKEVVNDIFDHFMLVILGLSFDPHPIIHTDDLDEITEEYQWWSTQLQERLGYGEAPQDY